jgi:hypothetical protein
MDEQNILSALVANIRNLEISMMAISNRLALAEAFNSQLAQGQIDIQNVLTKLIKDCKKSQTQNNLDQTVAELIRTVDQLKVTQNLLMIRLKASAS